MARKVAERDGFSFPANNCQLKISNRNTRKRCEIF